MRELFKRNYKAFRIGPLPAASINAALGTELEVADVWVSKACHRHIAEDHPADYDLIMANLIDIIRSPTFAGQDPQHGKNFYLVKRLTTGSEPTPVLVAIGLELSEHSTFNVKSAYSIRQEDITSRRMRGSLQMLVTN